MSSGPGQIRGMQRADGSLDFSTLYVPEPAFAHEVDLARIEDPANEEHFFGPLEEPAP